MGRVTILRSARAMKPESAKATLDTYWASFRRSRQTAISLDAWCYGNQFSLDDPDSPFYGRPFSPKGDTNEEYQNLAELSPTPFGGLVVKSIIQTAYVDGVKLPGSNENLGAWKTWQQNRMDTRQVSSFRGAAAHGASYGMVVPGVDPLTGDKMAKIILRSAKRMACFYDDDNDEWPRIAVDAERYTNRDTNGSMVRGWNVQLIDDYATHYLTCEGEGYDKDSWTYISHEPHGMGVCPVARCANSIDLDGKTTGELEPVIPMLRRIDQDIFDRLIVQRFGAWAIRYIAGMAKPETAQEQAALAAALRIDDLLMSDSPDTKFGALPITPPGGFIEVTDADIRMLSAITQTPPHHMLGLSSNLQAEALAAAESGLQRKSADFKMHAGEFVEQLMRMAATVMGNREEASAFDMQVRWRDTESRSFNQTAQALGMVATQLGVPLEMLWEKLPGWTDSDSLRAKNLVENGTFEELVRQLMEGGGTDVTGAGLSGAQPAGTSGTGTQ